MAILNLPSKRDCPISDSEISDGLNVAVRDRISRWLPAVAAAHLLFTVTWLSMSTADANKILLWSAFVTGVCLGVWKVSHQRTISNRTVQTLVFMIHILILGGCLMQLTLTAQISQVLLLLPLLTAAAMLLSERWFYTFTGSTMLSWTVVSLQVMTGQNWFFSILAVLAAGACSCAAFRAQLKTQRDVHKTLLRAERIKAKDEERLQRAKLALDGSSDGLWYWELDSGAFHVSSHWEALLGYSPGEVESDVEEWFSRVHPTYLAELHTAIADHLEGKTERFHNEHRLRQKDGTYIWVTARGTAVRGAEGKLLALAGSLADISSILAAETGLIEDAFHDKLTALPNRQFFIKHLEVAIEKDKRRNKLRPLFAVMFLDLDRFEVINDSMGHLAGDQLLVAVADRLRSCARQGDIVARFGGDEFMVLLNPVRNAEEAMSAAGRFCRAVNEPFQIDGREVTSGASVGVVISDQDASRAEDYLRYADMAMYHAKLQSKGSVQLFDQKMTAKATRLCDLQNDLARALGRQELELYYQPLVSVGSGRICGAEALIRWRRTDGGILLPGEFIPVAEDMGLINDIGEWALRTACAQNSAWQQAGLPPVRVSVNLSARQLQQSDFPHLVETILKEARLSSKWLELELTETALMDSLELAPATLDQLARHGTRLAIDDFGTGYSSLNYLRRYNFQALKMDRCFVSDVVTDKRAGAIAKGLISLAHNLDLSVVAEGVEHRDQLTFLAEENCDVVQGYLASTPVPSDVFNQLLHAASTGKKILESPSYPSRVADQRELHLAEASGVYVN